MIFTHIVVECVLLTMVQVAVFYYLSHSVKFSPEVDGKTVLGHIFHDFRGQ